MPAPSFSSRSGSARHDMSVILVTGSYDHEVRFWEAWSGICSRTISRKRLLAAAIHKKVLIYEIASTSSSPILTFEGHTGNVTSVSFHSEGKWLVTGSEDGTIKIWDLRSADMALMSYLDLILQQKLPTAPNIRQLGGRLWELISCDQAGSIKQWDLSENLCSHELTPAGDIPIRSVSLASDGSFLVAGNNKVSLPRFQAVTKFHAHNKYLTRCLLSPDAKHLATCSADTTVKVWSISHNYEFKHEKTLIGHQRWVWDCAFSADSAYLVTASSDHTARLWEMASGETVRQYNGHHKAAVCCALHDGAG
ncbi:TOR complex [Salix suchowensis]|nr:TOR complex [Salix suchowensis]